MPFIFRTHTQPQAPGSPAEPVEGASLPTPGPTQAAAHGQPAAGAGEPAQHRRPISEMFTVHPVAADYVALPSGEAVRNALVQAFRCGVPLAVLTGEAGTGKSMLATMAMASLKADVRHIAYLSSAPGSTAEIICSLALAFGMPMALLKDQQPQDWLQRTLIERQVQGESSLLVLDEAQKLTAGTWSEVLGWHQRLWHKGLRLHVLAVGLPVLLERMADPCLSARLVQPPLAVCLTPLDGWAMREFIGVTLRRSGRWGRPALDEGALDEIYRRTGGVLGRIQRLVGRSLQTAEIFELPAIDAETVALQADELGLQVDLGLPQDAGLLAPPPGPRGWPAAATTDDRSGAVPTDPPARPAADFPATARHAPAPRPQVPLSPAPLPQALPAQQRPPPPPAARWRLATAALAMLLVVAGMAAWLGGGPRGPELQAAALPGQASDLPDPAAKRVRSAAPAPAPAPAPVPTPTPQSSQNVSPTRELRPEATAAATRAAAPAVVVTPLAPGTAQADAPVVSSQPQMLPADPPQRLVAQTPPPASSCSVILARFSLGEPLSASDRTILASQCR